LDGKLELIIAGVRKGLENIFTEWDEKKFEALVKAYFMLEQNYTTIPFLLNELEAILKINVNTSRKNCVKSFQKNSPFQIKADENAKIKDFCNGLARDVYPKFLNRVFHEMSCLMYSTHLCSRYLEGKD
jgi:hypothetical protein